jgi:S-(hydroxymethyl)glutathione dehydrogenase/alcohol dehydrogenase
MKAAVLFEVNKPLMIEDVSVPNPGPREVLIRTRVAGLCHSDLHFMEGLYPHPLPVVLGHESAGVVEKVGSDVTYVKPGDHVVTCLSVFCGTCDNCTTGRTVLCTDTTVKMLPGQSNRLSWARSEKLNQFLNLSSFAEQMLVHENAIVKIRKDMPLELAALIGCGVITGYGAVVNTAKVTAGETVAVIGCGGVGMAAINGAAIAGAGPSSQSIPTRPSCSLPPSLAPPTSSIPGMATWCNRCVSSPAAACSTHSRCSDVRKPRSSRLRCWRRAAPRPSSA